MVFRCSGVICVGRDCDSVTGHQALSVTRSPECPAMPGAWSVRARPHTTTSQRHRGIPNFIQIMKIVIYWKVSIDIIHIITLRFFQIFIYVTVSWSAVWKLYTSFSYAILSTNDAVYRIHPWEMLKRDTCSFLGRNFFNSSSVNLPSRAHSSVRKIFLID